MSTTLINGSPATSIPVSDRAFQYGDGVFETIRVHGGRALLWELHRKRLLAGCEFLRIPVDLAALERELEHLLTLHHPVGVAKVIVSRGSGGRGYRPPDTSDSQRILQFHPLPEGSDLPAGKGINACLLKHPLSRNPSLTRYKLLGRIDQVIASMELAEGFPEGVMLTDDGLVIEGTRSNLFLVAGGELITPVLDEAGVQGVMRDYLLQRFREAGNRIQERLVTRHLFQDATELFFCNSVFGIWPVTELTTGETAVSYEVGSFARQAGRYVNELFSELA